MLMNYLLIRRDEDDKLKFLAEAGFPRDNPDRLEAEHTNSGVVINQAKGHVHRCAPTAT